MIYDNNTGQVVLFGGMSNSPPDNMWTYSPTENAWVNINNINPSSAPSAQAWLAMVYADNIGQAILFGGWRPSDGILDETWALKIEALTTFSLNQLPGWNLISLPLITSPTPSEVLSGLSPGWVLFAWDAANSRYLGGGQVTLELGHGYWLKLPGSDPLDYDVIGTSSEESEKAISLATGWNIVGVPSPNDLTWGDPKIRFQGNDLTLDEAVNQNLISGVAYYWTGSGYGNAKFGGGFQAGMGYWLKVLQSGCELLFSKP